VTDSRVEHTKLVMLIPSRNRPASAMAAAWSAIEHAELPGAEVRILADGHAWGSEMGLEYWSAWQAMVADMEPRFKAQTHLIYQGQHRGLAATLNGHVGSGLLNPELAVDHTDECRQAGGCNVVTHVGFMGDDHRVRTPGWDYALTRAAGPWGIAYGDDGIQGEALPTAVVLAADIVRTVGHIVPPTLQHMYIDNYWRELGIRIGRLIYMPGISIEHLHHSVGKSQVDATYLATNNAERYLADQMAWEAYQADGSLARDAGLILDAQAARP
jgi:hypothetical protein